ncbi:alpha/beta hydrolase YcfP [Agarivorans litoreus]|uniref:alpha/beta hydrolase YcfP n=1 Tax=Agarivorans litoreus TaxID=1510455 RepID=UPI001C7DAD6A|nr:alpha/beta hydrolase YcfP [Agarivorans litoreus]
MIIYLHGFDSTSPGNHEKVLQLQFVDPDVRPISYSTIHPRHDMSHLLKEVHKQLMLSAEEEVVICGVGLGGYWSERIGFLCGIPSVIFNPNLHPEVNMQGRIERPEEYIDIASKCVTEFRTKNKGNCTVVLSENDEVLDNKISEQELKEYYQVVWDKEQSHKFKDISHHLQLIKSLKRLPSL